MTKRFYLVLIIVNIIFTSSLLSQDRSDWKGGVPEGCTTITIGKKASFILTQPINSYATLAYSYGSNPIEKVIVAEES